MHLAALFLLAIAALLSGFSLTPGRTEPRQPLLGTGHGVDHVTILTKDLAAAAQEFRARLGFNDGAPTPFSFGFTGANIYFGDGTYIELYGIHDPAKIAEVGEGSALEASEGFPDISGANPVCCGRPEPAARSIVESRTIRVPCINFLGIPPCSAC